MKRYTLHIPIGVLLIIPVLAYAQATTSPAASSTSSTPAENQTASAANLQPGHSETLPAPAQTSQSAGSSTDITSLLLQLKSIDRTSASATATASGSGSSGGVSSAGSSSAGNSSGGNSNANVGNAPQQTGGASVTSETGPVGSYTAPLAPISIIQDLAVVWTTPVPATSEVYYSLIPPEEETADSSRVINEATTTVHSVLLKSLISNTTYYLLLVSHAPAGQAVYAERRVIRL